MGVMVYAESNSYIKLGVFIPYTNRVLTLSCWGRGRLPPKMTFFTFSVLCVSFLYIACAAKNNAAVSFWSYGTRSKIQNYIHY